MNDNQILVVHSRWVYNFMGIILEAQVSFIFSLLCIILCIKFVSDFGEFETLCVRRDSHRENTTCKWVWEMNRGIHCKSGTSFMGLADNARLSISNEESRTFLIPDANSCIDCESHKGWPRFAMNASIHLAHSFACSAFSMTVSSNV